MMRRPPSSPLFPSTTLFRSPVIAGRSAAVADAPGVRSTRRARESRTAERKSTRLKSHQTDINTMPSFFFNDAPPTELSPLSLHDALPISGDRRSQRGGRGRARRAVHAPRAELAHD